MTLPKQDPLANHVGQDVTDYLPDPSTVPGLAGFRPEDDAVWRLARPHLRVRSNDGHTAYAYGLAKALSWSPAVVRSATDWSGTRSPRRSGGRAGDGDGGWFIEPTVLAGVTLERLGADT